MDKDLGALRSERWNKAFAEQPLSQESSKDNVNRKATIVIEHLIQASDVAHTMQVRHSQFQSCRPCRKPSHRDDSYGFSRSSLLQHWHVYRKWNARLFREMYRAYVDGRADKYPSENWYKVSYCLCIWVIWGYFATDTHSWLHTGRAWFL